MILYKILTFKIGKTCVSKKKFILMGEVYLFKSLRSTVNSWKLVEESSTEKGSVVGKGSGTLEVSVKNFELINVM